MAGRHHLLDLFGTAREHGDWGYHVILEQSVGGVGVEVILVHQHVLVAADGPQPCHQLLVALPLHAPMYTGCGRVAIPGVGRWRPDWLCTRQTWGRVASITKQRRLLLLVGLFLVSLALRPQLVGVGPLLSTIRADLRVSHSVAGLLST